MSDHNPAPPDRCATLSDSRGPDRTLPALSALPDLAHVPTREVHPLDEPRPDRHRRRPLDHVHAIRRMPVSVGNGTVFIAMAGGPLLTVDGVVVGPRGPARQRSTLALAYLLFAQGRRVPADELADAVWPEGPPASWSASLRKLISDARSWLAGAGLDEVIAVVQQAYRIDLPPWASVDVEEAARAMAPGPDGRVALDGAAAAAALLEAELLPGFDTPWLQVRRAQARELRIAALEALADGLRVAGRWEEAIAATGEVIAIDPLRESAYRLAMAAHRDAGRVGSALRVYEQCRALLADELGSAPSASTVAAYQTLLFPFTADPLEHVGLQPSGSEGPTTFASMVLAMETVASRTAIGNLEGRLAAVESDPHPDPLARVELLIELGQARWALSGATDQLRRISLAAGEAALQLGSPSHFGAVAALASTTTGVGEQDPDTKELCDRAMEAFGHDPATRARILALQAESETGEASVAMSAEAVAIARAEGDHGLLLDTLLVLDQSIAWSTDLATRLAIERECQELLGYSGRWRTRPTFEPLTRLQGGELDWYRDEVARLEEESAHSTQWEPRFYAIAFRAVLAHLAGDLVTGFQLADQLMAESRDEINAVHSSAALYLALSRDSGGVANLLPVIEGVAADNPRISSFQAAVALGKAISGYPVEARLLLDDIVGEHLDDVPLDHIWLLTMGLLAEAVALDGTAEHARALLERLDPYAGQLCAGAHATVVLSSVDWCRGILQATAGDLDTAIEHYESALELEERIDAPLLRARTSAWLAAALVGRGRVGDRAQAEALAADATRLAVPAGIAMAVARVLQAARLPTR